MRSVAHISFEGGGLIVPAQTPYERELLFEHLEISAKRHGCVRLDVNRAHWTISLRDGDQEACALCRRGLGSLIYRFEDQTLCGQCARRALH
jgi:hypothetical protein